MGPWIWNRGRRTDLDESSWLQGINFRKDVLSRNKKITSVDDFKLHVMSCHQMGHALGNAVTLSVAERVLLSALHSARIVNRSRIEDRWGEGRVNPSW